MSDQGYTPTTEEVREYFEHDCTVIAEFDRWLAEVRREAAEEAWDEGERAGMRNSRLMVDGAEDGFGDNPYRKKVTA